MIKSRDDLKKTLELEKSVYFQKGEFSQKIVHSKNATIYKFQYYLRHEEYYLNSGKGLLNKIMLLYYKRKKNKLGQKLGFDIPANCFGPGLRIHHVAPVTVNGDARIGKNCRIFGNICIGVAPSGVPNIGDDCTLGYGSIIVGGINIADGCTIGAGSIVTKSVDVPESVVMGNPAKVRI